MDKTQQGILPKYEVRRTDGKDAPSEKHHGCFLFVLDIDHDEFSRAALSCYAKRCRSEYPLLADDLEFELMVREIGPEVMEEHLKALDRIAAEYPIKDPATGNLAGLLEDWAAKDPAQWPLSQFSSNMLVRKWRRIRQGT